MAAVIVLLICLTGAICLDLNRFQPWVYEYAIVIALIADFKECQIFREKSDTLLDDKNQGYPRITTLLAAIYFFSGLQKFNWRFIAYVGPWLLGATNSPVAACPDPLALIGSGLLAITELSLGLALCFNRTRRAAVILAIIMHGLILYVLSVKFKINAAVMPWNVTQMALLIFCAYNLKEPLRLKFFKPTAKNLLLATTCGLIPVLGLFQITDSYPSFCFYTGDVPYGQIYFDKPLYDRLPAEAQKKICFFDRELGLWVIDFLDWSNIEMGVPNYASTFCVGKMARTFAQTYPGDFLILETSTFPKLNNIKLLKYEQLGGSPDQLAAIRRRLSR